MKINFIKILPWSLLVFVNLLIVPFLISSTVFAQTTSGLNCAAQGLVEKAGICVTKASGSGIMGSNTLVELAKNVINVMLYIAGTIAVVFIIIGGYQYLTSSGNEEAAEKGRKTLINAIIGIIVIVLSYVIINVVTSSIAGGG